jgi:hypothetical protein
MNKFAWALVLMMVLVLTLLVNTRSKDSTRHRLDLDLPQELPADENRPQAGRVQNPRRSPAKLRENLTYDPQRHRDDPEYAREVDRLLTIQEAKSLLQDLDPVIRADITQVYQVLSNYFGGDVAMIQLRPTYCELAGISQWRDFLKEKESKIGESFPTYREIPAELKNDYLSGDELLVKKGIAFSKARLSLELGMPTESFFESLYALNIRKGIYPREDRLEPGQPIVAPEEETQGEESQEESP